MPDFPKDLDPAVQTALRELMREDYPLLLDTFIRDAQKRIAALADTLEQQQWEAFRQAAHSLKGSCGNMGAQALQEACARAEQAGLLADAQAARQQLAEITRLYRRVELLLQR